MLAYDHLFLTSPNMSQLDVDDIAPSTKHLAIVIQANQAVSQSKDISPREEKEGIPSRLITHNIRYATEHPFPGEEFWSIRRPTLCSELSFQAAVPATFICLQEVLHSQLMDITSSLNHGDKWSYIGVGRDDGVAAGEYSPILYRPSVFRLKSWRTVVSRHVL